MKRKLIYASFLSAVFGASVGYFLSLGSSFKKGYESMAAIPTAVLKMDDFSETDIAVLLRTVRLSEEGKSIHTDKIVLGYIAKYYNNRSKLSAAELQALSASGLLSKIQKLQETNGELKKSIVAESGRGDGIAPVTPPTPLDMRVRIRRFLSDDGDRP